MLRAPSFWDGRCGAINKKDGRVCTARFGDVGHDVHSSDLGRSWKATLDEEYLFPGRPRPPLRQTSFVFQPPRVRRGATRQGKRRAR